MFPKLPTDSQKVLPFPMNLPVSSKVQNGAGILATALHAAKAAPLSWVMRLVLWALGKFLKDAASEDDVRDLVTAADGVIGFAKRRFPVGGAARNALEMADDYLDQAHTTLGEASA